MLDSKDDIPVDLKFALPGKERQDSVYSGLEVLLLVSCLYLIETCPSCIFSPHFPHQ